MLPPLKWMGFKGFSCNGEPERELSVLYPDIILFSKSVLLLPFFGVQLIEFCKSLSEGVECCLNPVSQV